MADRSRSRSITNKIVHDLKTDPLTRPFDLLAKSMNYWRVAVPSPGRGISVRCEVYSYTEPPGTAPWAGSLGQARCAPRASGAEAEAA